MEIKEYVGAWSMEHYIEYIDNSLFCEESCLAFDKEDKRKVECFNCHNTGHFARECKFKGSKEGNRQEAGKGQNFKPVQIEKEALMTIDEGQINWVEQTTDEELNHALMAFTMNNEVSMCSKLCLDSYNALQAKYDELQSEFGDQEAALTAHKLAVKKLESQLRASHKQQSSLTEKLNFQANQIFEKDEKLKKYRRIGMKAVKDKDALQKIVDSWFASSKNLWKLIDCGMSSTVKIGLGYGIQSNAEVLGYEEEISRGIFAFRETDAGNYDIPLYSRFKQVEYKGVPHPLSGDYTPREQEDIDDSLYEYGKYGPQPQSPSPTVSDASSTVYSTCPSNDSDGELGAVSDHSVNDDPIHDHIPIPSIEQVTIATQKTQPQVPKPKQTVVPSCAQHVKTPRQPIRTPVTPSPIPSNNRQNWNQRMERELEVHKQPKADSEGPGSPKRNYLFLIVHDHPFKQMKHRGIFEVGCSGNKIKTGNEGPILKNYQELAKGGICYFWNEVRVIKRGVYMQETPHQNGVAERMNRKAAVSENIAKKKTSLPKAAIYYNQYPSLLDDIMAFRKELDALSFEAYTITAQAPTSN
ncbi:ribonuclease H-like domain-containing protein [Tanacetum coccineum]